MDPAIIRHLESIRPSIDVLGEWLVTCNAKTAQKAMMNVAMKSRQITHRRGLPNYRVVWERVILPRIDYVFMFTFVRNPWDRVVSAFHFLQQYRKKYEGLSFQDFVKTELKVKGTDVDPHFRPQAATFLCNGVMIPNLFVGRFERLAQDWGYVADKLRVQKNIPNLTPSRHKPFVEYYDDEECRSVVQNLYAEEIEALGYECRA